MPQHAATTWIRHKGSAAALMQTDRPRLALALCCGALAIDVNTALLAAVDAAGLPTAHGGVLRLLHVTILAMLGNTAAGQWGRAVLMPIMTGPGFQIGFHVAVGLAMAVFYVAVVRRLPPRRVWPNVIAYAVGVWLLNAAVVLPLIGEGFAGSRTLSLAGMVVFAAIHTVFFMLMAWLYQRLSCVSRAAWGAGS